MVLLIAKVIIKAIIKAQFKIILVMRLLILLKTATSLSFLSVKRFEIILLLIKESAIFNLKLY